MINILIQLKSGSNFTVSCESFHVSDGFIHFTLDKYIVCSIYADEVKYFYSFEYHYVNDDIIKKEDILFADGIILKTI